MPLRLDAPRSLLLATREVPLELSRHPRARRITLRLNQTGDGVRLADVVGGGVVTAAVAVAVGAGVVAWGSSSRKKR